MALLGCGSAVLALPASPAAAAAGWWHITTGAEPTNLPPGGEGDVVVNVTNLGDAQVNGSLTPIVIADQLPSGLEATAIHGLVREARAVSPQAAPVHCELASLTCELTGTVAIDEPVQVIIGVKVNEPAGTVAALTNRVEVQGGETPAAAAAQNVSVSGKPAAFGVELYELVPEDEGGALDTQAGSHPFQLTTTLAFDQTADPRKPPAAPRDVHAELPAGLFGDANAIPQCTDGQFSGSEENFVDQCPLESQVGVVSTTVFDPFLSNEIQTLTLPVFNLVPLPGEPARLGFEALGVPVVIDTTVRSGSDYGVNTSTTALSQTVALLGSRLVLWGVPGDARHNRARGWECLEENERFFPFGSHCTAPAQADDAPFLTLPTSCGTPLTSALEVDSWSAPGTFERREAPFATLSGCDALAFTPSITVQPDTAASYAPVGVSIGIHVPQESTLAPVGDAESAVKDTTVTLPEGLQINPASANSLEACSTAQAGFERIEAGTAYFSPGPPSCPEAAELATVQISTPLLAHPLTGGVYLASQNANPFGSLLALYMLAEEPVSGVRVKLAGKVSLDPVTGQLTSTFDNTPQLPFEALELHFFGGSSAPLSTSGCGRYTTTALFSPWAGTAPAAASSAFTINASCASTREFAPALTAGVSNLQAGSFSPFTTTVSRSDADEPLSRVAVHLPPGLLGRLAAVTPCGEPAAAEGECGPQSLIGHTTITVGVGSNPYTISGGPVYITGPYEGAPYGLSIAQPAKAGPLDLGTGRCDCVVVRARIEVDPHTAAISVTSDPLPTILQGIPVDLRFVNLTTDTPGFTSNPTNCSPLRVTAIATSVQGAVGEPSVPFEVANCATLPFRPSFAVRTQAKASKANGAALTVSLKSSAGQANIAKVRVALPRQLPSRLAALQKACVAAVFDANPASCPAASIAGSAIAVTPVLKAPLQGPAYLVSHGGAAFPDLEIVLQGEGVTLILDGQTAITKGITTSTFASVPDAPVSSFTLTLPEGPHSALAAHGNLCKAKLLMPTTITGQNGAVMRQSTRVAVSGCPKHKHTARHRRHKHARRP